MEYNQMEIMAKLESQNADKYKKFMERVDEFKNVTTLEEAHELAKKILPTSQEVSSFYVGNAKCVVVNTKDKLRISIDSDKEFISYDFS